MTQMKSFNVEIVSSGDSTLPPSGLVRLSLLDVSQADAPAISIAELRLRCGGVMPINLPMTFDSNLIDARHDYALAVRIEKDDRLHYMNTYRHSIDPYMVSATQRVTVDPVATGTGLLFSDNIIY